MACNIMIMPGLRRSFDIDMMGRVVVGRTPMRIRETEQVLLDVAKPKNRSPKYSIGMQSLSQATLDAKTMQVERIVTCQADRRGSRNDRLTFDSMIHR